MLRTINRILYERKYLGSKCITTGILYLWMFTELHKFAVDSNKIKESLELNKKVYNIKLNIK